MAKAIVCKPPLLPCLYSDPCSANTPENPVEDVGDFKSALVFAEVERELKEKGEEYVKKLKGIYCFKIKNGDKTAVWVVDAKNGSGSVKLDPNGKGDCTMTVSDDDFLKLITGQLNPQQAFFTGRIKMQGNIGLAFKLRQFQPKPGNSKL